MVVKQPSPAEFAAEEVDADDNVLARVWIVGNGTHPLRDVVIEAQLQNALRRDVLLEWERSLDGVAIVDAAIELQARGTILPIAPEGDHRLRHAEPHQLLAVCLNGITDSRDLIECP